MSHKPSSNQKVIPIHQAKTNLSQLVKDAQAGETIYIGAYGQPQAIIAPIPTKKPIMLGLGANDPQASHINYQHLEGPDQEIIDLFENSDLHLEAHDK